MNKFLDSCLHQIHHVKPHIDQLVARKEGRISRRSRTTSLLLPAHDWMGVIPPAFLKGPSRCFGALEGGQVFGLFVVVRCAGVHCYVNEVHLQHFSISNLVLALLYHTLFNKGTCFCHIECDRKKGDNL